MLLDADANMEVSGGGITAAVGALHADEVVSWLLEPVDRAGVAVLCQLDDIAVALHHHLRAAVAEIPRLLAVGCAEGADEERHGIACHDAEGRRVGGMDR